MAAKEHVDFSSFWGACWYPRRIRGRKRKDNEEVKAFPLK